MKSKTIEVDTTSVKNVQVVVDSVQQWAPYFTSDSVITAQSYLQNEMVAQPSSLVINLCSDLSYLSAGYYCSLLAQARRHKVLPTIETLNRLQCKVPGGVDHLLPSFCTCRSGADGNGEKVTDHFDLYFGKPDKVQYAKFARVIFEHYPAPLLRVTVTLEKPHQIMSIRSLALHELTDAQQDLFAESLDRFSAKVWRRPKSKKPARYDLAIFHNPEEAFPPSNRRALESFVSQARKMGVNAELLTEEDVGRLLEFDALFIRQTTAVDNITYKVAQTAEQADMVVIDDPSSIIRCTNKVYLQEFFVRNSFPIPNSQLIFSYAAPAYAELALRLGEQMVLKIPDGSFSVGMVKVKSDKEYEAAIDQLGERSSLLLVQEFIPTDYDWRVGILNGEAIYACKYFMARGHWQIYRHNDKGKTISGKYETIPVHLVPRKIIRLAEKVSGAIGKGLYGVDLKETANGLKIIEVNDNPSIDHGVEDRILGAELYRIILREFIARLDARRAQ